jgi:hypothetical protein
MTETEWLACTDPEALADWLGEGFSERKARLYACACCRLVAFLLRDVRAVRALEVTERYIEGNASSMELLAAHRWAEKAEYAAREDVLRWACAAVRSASGRPKEWIRNTSTVASSLASVAPAANAVECQPALDAQRARLAELFREVFGNPFRSMSLAPSWLGADVRGLAQAAYDERTQPAGTLDSARLAVLADALEEAGWTDPLLLDHLRGPGAHVRGCWALDHVLGRY